MIPVLMKGLGATAFGLWVVLNTFITTLQIFNLNIELTTVRNISFYAAAGHSKIVNDLVNGILRITVLLAVVVVLMGLILSVLVPYIDIPGLNSLPLDDIATCVVLATCIAVVKYFDKVFQSIFKAYEQYKKASILNSVNRISLLGINVVLAVKGASVTNLLWA